MKSTRLFENILDRLSGIRFALDAVPTPTAITDDETELLAEVETLLGVVQRLARRVGGFVGDRRSITQQRKVRYVGENLVCRACGRSGDALLSPCDNPKLQGLHLTYVQDLSPHWVSEGHGDDEVVIRYPEKGEDDEQDP